MEIGRLTVGPVACSVRDENLALTAEQLRGPCERLRLDDVGRATDDQRGHAQVAGLTSGPRTR